MSVVGVGAVLLVVSVLGYSVTRSGVRVTYQAPLTVADEVLLGLVLLLLAVLTLVCGGLAATLGAVGLSPPFTWAIALTVTGLLALPAAKRTWSAAEQQVDRVQAKRDARAGLPPSPRPTPRGRHQM